MLNLLTIDNEIDLPPQQTQTIVFEQLDNGRCWVHCSPDLFQMLHDLPGEFYLSPRGQVYDNYHCFLCQWGDVDQARSNLELHWQRQVNHV
jgi:hypothetical protein